MATVFLVGFLLCVWNVISVLLRVGRYSDPYRLEGADDPRSKDLAFDAYRRGLVGFPGLRKDVNCGEMLSKSRDGSAHAQQYPSHRVRLVDPKIYVQATFRNCDVFRKNFGYYRYPPVTQEELDFPIAFIILFHRDFHQVHFLLRAIYRPHNLYCLMPDANSEDPTTIQAARGLASCVPNVFVTSKLENITYAGFSRLQADLNCMTDLLRHKVPWKYVINMPGQQFPLRTNLGIVKLLRMFNGANDVVGMTGDRTVAKHYKYKYRQVKTNHGHLVMVPTDAPHPPPPFNLTVVKGSAYNTLSRDFVRFVASDTRVRPLLNWVKDVYSPDEYFWAMLNHNHFFSAPGHYPGVPDIKKSYTSFTLWQNDYPCRTMFVREICILTPADFPVLLHQEALFANKFYVFHFPAALHCLDQMIFNMSVLRQTRPLPPSYQIYFALPQTRQQRQQQQLLQQQQQQQRRLKLTEVLTK